MRFVTLGPLLEKALSLKAAYLKVKTLLFTELSIDAAAHFSVSQTLQLTIQYCPMAFGNKGAYWFSETEEKRNPYFGDMMLKCGENRDYMHYN